MGPFFGLGPNQAWASCSFIFWVSFLCPSPSQRVSWAGQSPAGSSGTGMGQMCSGLRPPSPCVADLQGLVARPACGQIALHKEHSPNRGPANKHGQGLMIGLSSFEVPSNRFPLVPPSHVTLAPNMPQPRQLYSTSPKPPASTASTPTYRRKRASLLCDLHSGCLVRSLSLSSPCVGVFVNQTTFLLFEGFRVPKP